MDMNNNLNNIKEAINQLRMQGFTENDFYKIFFVMFQRGDIDYDTFVSALKEVGLDLPEQFAELSPDQLKQVNIFEDGYNYDEEQKTINNMYGLK